MAKKDIDMSRCQSCKNLDKEQSFGNWLVCPVMPIEVMVYGSKDRQKYSSNDLLNSESVSVPLAGNKTNEQKEPS